jgi:hypothetical protein
MDAITLFETLSIYPEAMEVAEIIPEILDTDPRMFDIQIEDPETVSSPIDDFVVDYAWTNNLF